MRPNLVLLLFGNSLLGRGIADYLRQRTGADVRLVPASEPAQVLGALAEGPRVVIYERTASVADLDLGELVPDAVLVDVSAVLSTGPYVPEPTSPADVERIVADACGVLG